MDWDYLIITASNAPQAEAYRRQIDLRRSLGFIHDVERILVVPDPAGIRVGSGGSTVHCLLRVLDLELGGKPGGKARARSGVEAWASIFSRLRILIVHAGGDSRRLPPYGPCGKIFVPVPGEAGGAAGTTIFDRLVPAYLRLPRPVDGRGQVVVTSGDVLLDFDAASVSFSAKGITGVGAFVGPEVARNHGVYCREESGEVRLFLQKPTPARQSAAGALNGQGQAILDIGVLNLSPEASVRLLELCRVRNAQHKGRPGLRSSGPLAGAIEKSGLDIYREICCALGGETDLGGYIDQVREAGSRVDTGVLKSLYRGLKSLPFFVDVVPRFRFLHFGTLRDLIDSGRSLVESESAEPARAAGVFVNSLTAPRGSIHGAASWVEGCRIAAPLTLGGDNVLAGVDIEIPMSLPPGGSIDLLEGAGRGGRRGWFVRLYSTDDAFHLPADKGGRLAGVPLTEWLKAMGAEPEEIWPADLPETERTVWKGRFFPFLRDRQGYQDWLWLLEPGQATAAQKQQWRAASRFSLEEISARADLRAFEARRLAIRSELAWGALARTLSPASDLSAAEIAFLIKSAPAGKRSERVAALVREAARAAGESNRLQSGGLEALGFSRVLHTAGSVLAELSDGGRGLRVARDLKEDAFRHLGRTIVYRGGRVPSPPRNVLRSDEIVWGRAPARLDIGGGWTDTPPYSLERGGRVINAAVNLNGQAPIQAYARVIEKPEVRINSIDLGARVVVGSLDKLLDYRKPGSQFALAKAALALAGFSPASASWPRGVRSLEGMLRRFGGGIELTTLAAIPSGSGLGTSSIMGAVLLSVIGRMIGRPLSPRDLFHAVLQLEQELTTGGGWQDQIGGVVEGVKVIEADRGLVPDPRIRFVPAELLDPAANGGRTLLYYTGLRRLAKNILHEVVGRYLDRDRQAMETLRRLHAFPPLMAEAMAMRDAERFGELIDVAWRLNVDLDPDHTTPVIERLRGRIRPHILGAKLLGAGGGGFLLMACRSSEDALAVRRMLEKDPPNDKARFFDYSISRAGLVVTVC